MDGKTTSITHNFWTPNIVKRLDATDQIMMAKLHQLRTTFERQSVLLTAGTSMIKYFETIYIFVIFLSLTKHILVCTENLDHSLKVYHLQEIFTKLIHFNSCIYS